MTALLTDLFVVAHTHWDREWYHTADGFRQRLVRLIDNLLDDPPLAGESFLLDGQAIVLEDYLGVRPERAAELATLLREARVEAGPWYVLPDALMPSGEALVRNLLVGRDTVRRLRGEPPPVLYCPDSFGHPAILPDLAAGFGYGLVVLWRGLGGARTAVADIVRWRGAAGNSVIVYHLPPDGYEFGRNLPADTYASALRWLRIAEGLGPRAVSGTAILLNGADHHARQSDRATAMSALSAAAAPVRVHGTSLSVAARAILGAAARTTLDDVAGELRDSYGYTWTLQGTFGTRAAQKRRNAMAERCLVRDVEPWIALSAGGGDGATRALLDAAWRTLLQAHPHDTLCGTSIDAVAVAFDARLAAAEVQSRGLRAHAVDGLAAHDRERARADSSAWRPAVVLRNPVARPRGGVVELTLQATLADIAVGPGSATRQGVRRRLPAWRVDGVPLQILSRHERVALTEAPRAYPDADLVAEVCAVGWVEPMGGYTIETRLQRSRAGRGVPHPVVSSNGVLDNGRVRVSVRADGEVTFEDRELGRRIANVVSLERARDEGDLYTPAIRDRIPMPAPGGPRLVHRGPLRGEVALEFPAGPRTGGRDGFCRVSLQLDADSRAVRLLVRGNNRSADHRLRLRVATGLAGSTTLADAAFLPVERGALSVRASDAAFEQVVPTAPLHRWVARCAGDASAVLVSDGLAEYESLDDGAICVTLVRAVGQLSRANLPERPGHAGWPAPTPGAQCIGPYEARLALRLFRTNSPEVREQIEQFAEDTLLPITGNTLRSNLLDPHCAGGLELRGAGLAFSSAAPARSTGWIVLRCVNHGTTRVDGVWRVGRDVTEAVRARLDESPLGALAVSGRDVGFAAAPREIVTILVR